MATERSESGNQDRDRQSPAPESSASEVPSEVSSIADAESAGDPRGAESSAAQRIPVDVAEAAERAAAERYVFTPLIDIYETEDGLVLCADLPGVSAETLELQVQDNKLTLFGRVAPPVIEEAQPRHQEYQVGDFLRSFILSDGVDHDRITARLNNGVLTLTLPRIPETRPRRIEVSSD